MIIHYNIFEDLRPPIVRKVDNTSHWINLYPLDNAILVSLKLISWIVIYLLDSTIQRLNNQGQVCAIAEPGGPWHLHI